MKNRKSIFVFAKAQVSAFLGGITDYALMILLTELLHIHFTISILISGVLGAVVNFSINRHWAFKENRGFENSKNLQLLKFSAVVLGSISLKSLGTYLLHSGLNIDYKIGRLLFDSLVSYGFNYPLMKYWVFNTKKENYAN